MRFNCHICGGGATFAEPPYFVHELSGCYIAPNAKIGRNCTIFQNVTIGIKSLNDIERKAPVIGDNVTIGAGACIIGGVRVGNNVNIGANAVVIDDVPDNTTVVLPKSRYINKE